jgi:hypothetical protein
MFNLVKGSDKNKSFVFQQTRDKEVWFCFRETGTSGSGCNKAFVYNYMSQSVHIRTLPDITDLYETEIDGQLAIYAAADSSVVKQLSNTLLETSGWFSRTDDSLGSNDRYKDINQIFPESTGSFKIAIVSSSGPLTASELNTQFNLKDKVYDPALTYKLDVRDSGRYLNMRVTMNGTVNPKLTTLQFSLRAPSKR